ncbi:MAG: DUF2157 domain-containing protein [Sinobacterium sp.]|nr:DUF2157 domain-containing protein [Sinobacterium sp.]
MKKQQYQWLTQQLDLWQRQDIIDAGQSLAIKNLYPEQESNTARWVLSSIGAVIFGLGIILFFAYNWQDMPKLLKLGIIFSGILVSHATAQWLDKTQKYPAASEGLSLLGTLLFGAGIWLVSQVYHIDEYYPNAFIAWGGGALLMAWARESYAQALLALALLTIWQCLEIFNFNYFNPWAAWIVLLGIAPLAWKLRSAFILCATLSSFYFLFIMNLYKPLDEALLYPVFTLTLIFIGLGSVCGRIKHIDFPLVRYALNTPGFAVYLTAVFIGTFAYSEGSNIDMPMVTTDIQSVTFWLSMLIAIATCIITIAPIKSLNKVSEMDALHMLIATATLLLTFFIARNWVDLSYGLFSSLMNLVFIAHCLLFILSGSKEQRGWEVAVGCLLFSALVFARYTDLFDSLLSRSAVFIILGTSLFVVGNFYSRQKNKLDESPAGAEI